MKKEIIGDLLATNYGSNNYSCGMEAIVFNAMLTTIERVKGLPNVFLHPTVESNKLDIFALKGNQVQFKEFYESAKASHCAKKAFDKFGMPEMDDTETWNKLHDYIEELKKEFKAWYE